MEEEEGKEGPIKCIFLCKFHPKLGPIIVCQYPENFLSKEVFESIHNYLITKIQIKKKTITLSVFGLKVCGYPNEIKNSKYLRNALIYNICFVCDYKSRSVQYEPIVKKISEYLESLEMENGFLSSEECEAKLPAVLKQILEEINERGKCTVRLTLQNPPIAERRTSCRSEKKPDIDYNKPISNKQDYRYSYTDRKKIHSLVNKPLDNSVTTTENSNSSIDDAVPNITVLNLKQVSRTRSDYVQVQAHHVPYLLFSKSEVARMCHQWDLTTQQILSYIDGVLHVAKIAAEADVHINLVKACMQNLIHYQIIKLLPIFQYTNMYTALPGLQKLITSHDLQEECLKAVSKSLIRLAPLSHVMQMYSSFTYGVSVRDLCLRFKPQNLNIDDRSLIQFGLLSGFIRRLHQYPVLNSRLDEEDTQSSALGQFYKMCNGYHCIDELCCKFGVTYQEVMDRVERHPGISVIVK